MKHELILKRDNGDKVKIIASASITIWDQGITYKVNVHTMAKGKRTWLGTHSTDDYSWRRLDKEGRNKYEMDCYLKHVTEDEILQAKLALWEEMRPK